MDNFPHAADMPVGFTMALSQNAAAMRRFASMSPEDQLRVIDGARGVASREEMHGYVESLAKAGGQ